MRLLTFTQYQKHNTLFTPLKGSIATISLQITLPKINNDKIHLSDEVMIIYGRNKVLTKPEQPIKMILSKGIYSIEQFNQVLAKTKRFSQDNGNHHKLKTTRLKYLSFTCLRLQTCCSKHWELITQILLPLQDHHSTKECTTLH